MAKSKRKKKQKRRVRIGRVLILLLIPILLFAAAMWVSYNNSLKPVQKESETVRFTVQSGESVKEVAAALEEEGLIKNDFYAYYFVRSNDLSDVKVGTYELNKNWDVRKIFETLNDSNAGIEDTVSVTIIEGDWAKHAAQKIAEVTNVSYEELMSLWNDDDYIRSLMDRYPFITEDVFADDVRIKLEGYLAPNTYLFYPETDARTVTEKILDQQLAVYNSVKEAIESSPYSVHELYTLASIVQYESGKIDDMRLIAGVFYNRLDINMPLQSSVTVCYAMDEDNGENWLACEANSDYNSPYNTYMYPGLPPGPIVNPGDEAIEAVLNPEPSNYYYFMADVSTGVVYYATTLEEHNANVAAHTTYH